MTGLGPVSVLPLATGMSLTLVLLALRGQRGPGADTVVWSRVDQKTCLKAVTAAGLRPHVVELRREGDQLVTDLEVCVYRGVSRSAPHSRPCLKLPACTRACSCFGSEIRPAVMAQLPQLDLTLHPTPPGLPQAISSAIDAVGPDRVLAVITTSSCFAPRAPDDLVGVGRLCAAREVPHVVNNAYGVQSRELCAAVSAAWNKGRVDAVVQVGGWVGRACVVHVVHGC